MENKLCDHCQKVYCHDGYGKKSYGLGFSDDDKKELTITWEDGIYRLEVHTEHDISTPCQLNFCPKCGRDLRPKECSLDPEESWKLAQSIAILCNTVTKLEADVKELQSNRASSEESISKQAWDRLTSRDKSGDCTCYNPNKRYTASNHELTHALCDLEDILERTGYTPYILEGWLREAKREHSNNHQIKRMLSLHKRLPATYSCESRCNCENFLLLFVLDDILNRKES